MIQASTRAFLYEKTVRNQSSWKGPTGVARENPPCTVPEKLCILEANLTEMFSKIT